MKTAILPVSEAGMEIARTLSQELPDAAIFTTHEESGCTPVDSLGGFVKERFNQFDAFVFIGAMGICVRTIAPMVRDKHTDPAIVCVDSTGQYAVSVLSGHIGGANALTRQVAGIIGAEPVVTTQSDRIGLWALDELPGRFGWYCEGNLNVAIARFVEQLPTALLLETRDRGTAWLEAHLPPFIEVFYHEEDINPRRFKLLISVSPRTPRIASQLPSVCYYPKVVHIGVGLAHMAVPASIIKEQIAGRLMESGIPWQAVASVATIDVKADEPVINLLREELPVTIYTADELKQVDVPNPSEFAMKHVGSPSVAEAAALLASRGGLLLMPKKKGELYTVAAAMDADALRQGHIEIVGAGPGDPDLVSVRGRRLLEQADLILYAGSLVPAELTACAKAGATVRSSASMDLQEQLALVKSFYDRGLYVVRLHTGDPCIYGAIGEQMALFDRYGMDYHITPGISSFQAAAAALKSQFTIPERVQSIILTRGEGRTPMPEREKLHLLAHSQSTMCIFLSAGIVEEVATELLQEYPGTTPVAVCHHLTWPDERIYRGTLQELVSLVKDNDLTLTTMIVVGEAIGNREGLSRLYAQEFKHLFRKE
ncbi:MAG: precorrin-4 C(11)-methyltransferase [Prevotellaceae bacterium]|nr:precorrin-4 C(11)-methyltransferase [Prevotellaceae bacterium]